MIFLSYSSRDSVEAQLLQFALETLLSDIGMKIWTYERDQVKNEKVVAEALKQKIKDSDEALIFLVSDSTLGGGAAQWMELAYADAFDVPTYVLLHRITYDELKAPAANVPPLLLAAHANSAGRWREIAAEVRASIGEGKVMR